MAGEPRNPPAGMPRIVPMISYDVAAHYEQAKRTGATILSELEETPFGDRHYRAEDPGATAGCSRSTSATSHRRTGARRPA